MNLGYWRDKTGKPLVKKDKTSKTALSKNGKWEKIKWNWRKDKMGNSHVYMAVHMLCLKLENT